MLSVSVLVFNSEYVWNWARLSEVVAVGAEILIWLAEGRVVELLFRLIGKKSFIKIVG